MSANATPETGSRAKELADLVDGLIARVKAGERVDVDALQREHPDHAEELRRLLPAVQMMADLSRSAAEGSVLRDEAGAPLGELGDYRLIREVGRGGMGVVYKAEQMSLGRRVALKVLPFAATMDPRQLQRFKNEARAAASLHHEHIVPVHGVGCERGVHFYAMQFIDGTTLAELIRGLRPEGYRSAVDLADAQSGRPDADALTPPAATLPTAGSVALDKAHFRRSAELVAQAADALEYAHSVGVVHRDVKPGNLMVDAAGKLWVTDFGLAKLDAAAGMTVSGDLIGTLRYMSPEQALAKHGLVDHRTDVYSLGATLYELLTLRPAVDGADKEDVLQRIAFDEPVPPRKLVRSIPVELETVLLTALAKDPADRYATAAEMADDLRRWLVGKPLRARRAGRWEQVAKWVRRRPALAALLAVTAFSAAALVTGLLWHNDRLRQAAEREQRQANKAAQQRDVARQAVNDMYTQVAEKWLASEPRMTDVQREFLEKALRYYEDLVREEGEKPELSLERAKASRRMGAILGKLGRRPEAEAAYRHAVTILEGADVPEKGRELAGSYFELGSFLTVARATNAEGQSLLRRALALWDELPADVIAQPEIRIRRANILNSLGITFYQSGRLAEGEPLLQRSLTLVRGLATEFPKEPRYQHLLGGVLCNLAIAAMVLRGDATGARQYLEEAIAHNEELVKLAPQSAEHRLFLRNSYGMLATGPLTTLKQFPEAVVAARKGLAVAEGLATDFPKVPKYQSILADADYDLGRTLMLSGQSAEAEKTLGEAVPILERLLAADPNSSPDYSTDRNTAIDIYCRLAELRQSSGRNRDAVSSWRKALKLDPVNAMANSNLAWSLALGAEPGFNNPAELVRLARTATETNPREGSHWITLGLAHYRSGACAAAKAALAKASKQSPIDDGLRELVLAMAEWKLGNQTAARSAYDRAIERWRQDRPKPGNDEARRLQAEAAQLLEVTGPAAKP